MGSEKVLENFSRGSWKVLEKSWIFFVSKRVGTLFCILVVWHRDILQLSLSCRQVICLYLCWNLSAMTQIQTSIQSASETALLASLMWVVFSIDFFVYLFLSLFLCQQDYEKMPGLICMKFSGKVWNDPGMTWLHFWSILRNHAMLRCATRGRGLLCFSTTACLFVWFHNLSSCHNCHKSYNVLICCTLQMADVTLWYGKLFLLLYLSVVAGIMNNRRQLCHQR